MTETPPRLTFKWAFLCDLIRTEDSGKLIIIGAYTGDVGIPELPATMTFYLVAGVESDQGGDLQFRLRVRLGDIDLVKGSGSLTVAGSGYTLMPFGPFPFRTKDAGILSFEFSQVEDEWETILSIPLQVAKPPA